MPAKMIRMMSIGANLGYAIEMPLDLDVVMGVTKEFLLSEHWYCVSCCSNPEFQTALQNSKAYESAPYRSTESVCAQQWELIPPPLSVMVKSSPRKR